MIYEDHPSQHENSHTVIYTGVYRFEFVEKSMETETTTWWKAIVEQILALNEINESKRVGLWESQSGIRVGEIIIWVRSEKL